jgi:hypothetical protein
MTRASWERAHPRNHEATRRAREILRGRILALVTSRGTDGVTPEDLREELATRGNPREIHAEAARAKKAGQLVQDNRGHGLRWYLAGERAS